jgi:hypothetical protein
MIGALTAVLGMMRRAKARVQSAVAPMQRQVTIVSSPEPKPSSILRRILVDTDSAYIALFKACVRKELENLGFQVKYVEVSNEIETFQNEPGLLSLLVVQGWKNGQCFMMKTVLQDLAAIESSYRDSICSPIVRLGAIYLCLDDMLKDINKEWSKIET